MANDKPLYTDVNIDGKTQKFADPQHFTGDDNEGRARTGEKDPFPTKDTDVKQELESIKDTQNEILERLDGTFDTQVIGRILIHHRR